MRILNGFVAYSLLLSVCILWLAFQSKQSNILTEMQQIEIDTVRATQLIEKEKELTAKGLYQESIELIKEAASLFEKHGKWEETIQCWIRIAELSDNMDTADLKILSANRAFSLAQKYLSGEHPKRGSALRQKAEAFMMLDSLEKANNFLNRAIPIFKKNEIWIDLAWSEILLGVNYLNQYQLDSCKKHLDATQELLLKATFTEEDRLDVESTLFNLYGVLFDYLGDVDRAIEITEKALELELNKLNLTGTDSSYIAHHYYNLGAYYRLKEDNNRSMDCFLQALSSYKKTSEDPSIYYAIGQLFLLKNDYRKAIDYFEKSESLSKKDQLKNRINNLLGLGVSYRELKLYDKAEHYFREALEIPSDFKKIMVWTGLGTIYLHKNNPEKAIEYLNTAQELFKNEAQSTQYIPFFKAILFNYLGEGYAQKKENQKALKYYQKALIANHPQFSDSSNLRANPSLSGIHDPIYFLETLKGKAKSQAFIAKKKEELEVAMSSYKLLIQWTDTLRNNYPTEASQLDWTAEFKKIYEEAISVAYQLYQKTQDSKYLQDAFTVSEKSKNVILLDRLKSSEGKLLAGVPDSILQREKDLNLDIAFYQKVLEKAEHEKAKNKINLYQNYLSKSRLDLGALREQLEKEYPKYHDWKYGGDVITIATIQQEILNKETAFLEYFIGDSASYVFVIRKTTADLIRLESPAILQGKTTAFRTELLNPSGFQQNAKAAFERYQQKARALYQQILSPAITVFLPDIHQLIVVPDAFLNSLPFAALCGDEEAPISMNFSDLPYLLYDFQFQYAYSAGLLFKNRDRHKQLPSNALCLAFAPSYSEDESVAQRGNFKQLRNMGELKGTTNEIQQIAQFFDGQFDFGASATEQKFKQSAHQFGILHLAMHGIVDFENANFNHLVFSNLNTDSSEDNLLHHYEIANMDLSAQLAVLSACETGLGKYEKGEGVYSLARSFMYAGIPSVVMSLWKVNDLSTSEMMPYFYENLAKGKSKPHALNEAKLRFLQEANLEHRHPFFWAGFAMLGDASPIKSSSPSFFWWGIGILLLSILGWWFWKRD